MALSCLAVFSLAAASARGGVVAQDDFTYPDGDFATGASGGTGWAPGGWTDGGAGGTTISAGRLRVSGGVPASANNPNLATRTLASPLTRDFYISFTLDVSSASIGNNDFLTFWLNDSPTYETDIPTIGLKGNGGDGSTSNDIMVRLSGQGGEFAAGSDASGVIGIVGRLTKSAAVYDEFALWVISSPGAGFPSFASLGAPDAIATIGGTLSTITTVGIRTANLDSASVPGTDVLFVDDLQIYAVPEPATMTIWGLGGVAGLAYAWRKRRRARQPA